MVAGADEAALLCAPECEAHASAGLRRSPGQSQRRFEYYSRAATIVVDARPLRHAVEMRANDDLCQMSLPLEAEAALVDWLRLHGFNVDFRRQCS